MTIEMVRISSHLPELSEVDYAIAHRDCSTDHWVWLRYMLVRIRNVAPAQHQAGQRRIGQSERIIYQVAKNKPVELLGRGADGRNRPTVSVGKSSRMTLLMMTWLMQRSGRDRRRAASTGS